MVTGLPWETMVPGSAWMEGLGRTSACPWSLGPQHSPRQRRAVKVRVVALPLMVPSRAGDLQRPQSPQDGQTHWAWRSRLGGVRLGFLLSLAPLSLKGGAEATVGSGGLSDQIRLTDSPPPPRRDSACLFRLLLVPSLIRSVTSRRRVQGCKKPGRPRSHLSACPGSYSACRRGCVILGK